MTVMNTMRATPRGWMAAAAFLFSATRIWAADANAPIPVEDFFKKPLVAFAHLSPTGRHVALTAMSKDGDEQLVVLDTATLTAKVVAGFQKADIVNVHWISGKRLVFGAGDREHRLSDSMAGPGLYAVDLDGSDYRQLARVDWNRTTNDAGHARMLDVTTRFLSVMPGQDSDSIFVTQAKWSADHEFKTLSLLKLDTRTGATSSVERPGDSWNFKIAPDGVARIATVHQGKGDVSIQYLDGDNWVSIAQFNVFEGAGQMLPIGFAPDGTFFVTRRGGDGTAALYTFDLKKKELSKQPVLEVKGFDIYPRLDSTREGLAGFHFESDADTTYWLDPKIKQVQAKVDKALPTTVNVLDVPYRNETSFVVVRAYSDADPGEYFLYDTKSEKLVRIGRASSTVQPERMARRDFVHYKARDGLDIPAWLTTPKDGKKGAHPMVVLVHGGPFMRGGTWQWDAESQFLASRGYTVLEPEFRGSEGFGFKHFKAGWKQWGLAMQNDVADGARWAIDKGIADSKRICIGGASYGGYATLMGLANDPDLYRCGFEWVGVTDLDLLYSAGWSDTSDVYKEYGLPMLVGDRTKDAAQLKATSPVTVAEKITQPLLMGAGAQDRRVPIQHGTSFHDQVEKTNKNVEWVVYPDEGHGWRELKDNVDWWTRVEKFLARNIGDEAKPQ
jgi:dipeptidyl aminopeptidase/acylaminoacyl peptidase